MIQYLKTAYINPKDVYKGKNMTNGQAIKYFMFLVLLMLVVILSQMFPIYQQLNRDIDEIADNIPEFTVEDGLMESEADSYIHLTDSIIFTYDNNDEINMSDIEEASLGIQSPIIFSLYEDHLSLTLLGNTQTISYESLDDFTSQDFAELLRSLDNYSLISIILALIILTFMTSISFLFEVLAISIIGYFTSLFILRGLGFGSSFKITLLSVTIPLTLMAIVNLLGITTLYDFHLRFFFSLFIYIFSIYRFRKSKDA